MRIRTLLFVAVSLALTAPTSAQLGGPGIYAAYRLQWWRAGEAARQSADAAAVGVSAQDSWTRDGNAVTRGRVTTLPDGRTIQRSSTSTRDGATVTREGQGTGPNGKTATSTDTWTRDGNTVTHEGTTTLPNGKTVERESTLTKDGDTIIREGQVTGPNGATLNTTGSRERSGNTVVRQGSATVSRAAGQLKPAQGAVRATPKTLRIAKPAPKKPQ